MGIYIALAVSVCFNLVLLLFVIKFQNKLDEWIEEIKALKLKNTNTLDVIDDAFDELNDIQTQINTPKPESYVRTIDVNSPEFKEYQKEPQIKLMDDVPYPTVVTASLEEPPKPEPQKKSLTIEENITENITIEKSPKLEETQQLDLNPPKNEPQPNLAENPSNPGHVKTLSSEYDFMKKYY
jgi:hypothetical protein